jgi:acetolactate synthase regulatory subunit
MYVFEIEASDIYSVLGRVLDRSRVSGLRTAAVNAEETGGGYAISVTVDTTDRALVERLAHQFAGTFGVISVSVERAVTSRASSPAFAPVRGTLEAIAVSA